MRAPRILILEDDPHATAALRLALEASHPLRCFSRGDEAETWLEAARPELVILDLHLGESSGLDWLKRWRKRYPGSKFIFCSAERNIDAAVPCLREGAVDFVTKPFSRERLLGSVASALERPPATKGDPGPVFVGESDAARRIRARLERLRDCPDVNVMFLGETGTGKEVAARYLNAGTARSFVAVNAAAIALPLAEAEFFGVEKGAYPAAVAARAGLLERAHHGDLFIDEIEELSPDLQAKLLRALQEREVVRVGGEIARPADVRIVSASNRSPENLREDFYFRVAEEVITLPPLRERKEDIDPLCDYFLAPRHVGISAGAREKLRAYAWPGNVRQLASVLKRAAYACESGIIDEIPTLDFRAASAPAPADWKSAVGQSEAALLAEALRRHGGNLRAVARALGLSRSTLYRKMKKAGIAPGLFPN